jgi:hypothetical protein
MNTLVLHSVSNEVGLNSAGGSRIQCAMRTQRAKRLYYNGLVALAFYFASRTE